MKETLNRRLDPNISETELILLKVLWRAGELSAREVHDEIAEATGWAYTTTRSILDRMAGKDLVRKIDSHGLYLYEPLLSRPRGLAGFIRRFATRLLNVDPAEVVPMFVEGEGLSATELRELRRLVQTGRGSEKK